MMGQDPFEVKMLSEETFIHYLARVTIFITYHVADSDSPSHDRATQTPCLLSSLLWEEPWYDFRISIKALSKLMIWETTTSKFALF